MKGKSFICINLILALGFLCSLIFANQYENKSIHAIVDDGNLEGVKKLLIENPELVNAVTKEQKETPLHVAVKAHRGGRIASLAIVKLLVSKGADVNAKDVNNETPVDYALATRGTDGRMADSTGAQDEPIQEG